MFKSIRRFILGKRYVDINAEYQFRYLNLLPIAGYIILALTVLDYGFVLVNLKLTDPYSEFEAMGGFVEKIWSPLLGCLLLFYPRNKKIKKREKTFLSIISWAVLLLGIVYILIVPLLFFDGNRINNDLQTKFDEQVRQSNIQLQQFEKRLNEVPDEQLLAQAQQLQQNNNFPVVGSAEEVRLQLLSQTKATQNAQISEARKTLFKQKKKIKTSMIKWIIGAVLSAILLMNIWDYSDWTRT